MDISRREMAVYGILTAAAAASGLAAARAGSLEAFDVSMAVEEFRKAMTEGDHQVLRDLADPDLSFGEADGRVLSLQGLIDMLNPDGHIYRSITLAQKRLEIVGSIAIERHQLNADAVIAGEHQTLEFEVVEVWQKGDQWRLIVRQAFNS